MNKYDKEKYNLEYELLELAIQAATATAEVISAYLKPSGVEFKSNSTNPVTAADKSGEAVIKKLIQEIRPDDGLIGEEGSDKSSKTGLRWVFDPLDGTVNYIYRIPHWGISIACEAFDGTNWGPIVGVVYDVMRDEFFTAIRGRGAALNGVKIKVNKTRDISKALITTEFSYVRENRIYQAEILSKLLQQVQDVRSYGSSALDICWVACGRSDGFYENELCLWDWSAGSLIVEEAGGTVSQLGTGVVASSSPIHENLYKLVQIDGES